MITALAALDERGSECDAVVTLPCDVIAPSPAAARRVAEALAAADHNPTGGSSATDAAVPIGGAVLQWTDAAVPIGGGVAQWAHAAWRPSSLNPLAAAFDSGVRALHEAAARLRWVRVHIGDPASGDWFRDADRPEDLPGQQRSADYPGSAINFWDTRMDSSGTHTDIPEIDIDELERRIADGAAVFDVREPDEHEEVRIPGAVLVPLATVPEAVEQFRAAATSRQVCVVCAVGGRSGQAVAYLQSLGVDAVNVAGGTNAWAQSGRPVEAGPTKH